MASSLLTEYRRKADELLAQYRYAKQRIADESEQLDNARRDLHHANEAQQLIQRVAQEIQQQAHSQIAKVASRCLEAVFDDPYEFRLVFERKRGKTEARPVFVRNGHELHPTSASGIGAVDIAAFALRLASMMLTRPATRRLLVLDEPFKNVSERYRPQLREMLETLADELDLQIIMVTHIRELETGKVIEV